MILKSLKFQGFTLIEFLVVIVIIVIMTTLILANYRSSQREYSLEGAGQELITHLRRAQNMAVTGTIYQGEVPAGGYGLYFDTSSPDSYILFADGDENYTYQLGEEIETIALPSNIEIDSLATDLGSESYLNIVFVPPDPETKINDGPANEAIISLAEQTTGQSKNIVVNSVGMIE